MDNDAGDRKQVKVSILNQSFTLLTGGDPGQMIELANQVDELMASIARKSPNLDSTRVAIFACLHLAGQLRSRQHQFDETVQRFSQLLDQALQDSRQ